MEKFYKIIGSQTFPRFHTTKYKIRLKRTITGPVNDFMTIIQDLIRSNNFQSHMVVSFGARDSHDKEFFINRYQRQPIYIDQMMDCDFFPTMLLVVCSKILNSGQSLEFEQHCTITISFTQFPFEYLAQRGSRSNSEIRILNIE